MCTHLTSVLASSTALQEPGPSKQGGGAGEEGTGEREDLGCPLCTTAICKLQELDPNGQPGGGAALDGCVAGQLDRWTPPHSAPQGRRFPTQISASSTDICYPRKRFDIAPNGFSVCSFLTVERPPRKTKYVYKKGHAPRRENMIPAPRQFLVAKS